MKRLTKILAALCLSVCAAVLLAFSAACAPKAPTITYDTDGGSYIESITANAGSKIYPPADPVREGYRFDGWELDGQTFEFDVMPQNDITLKAVWTKVYSIIFNTGEGSPLEPAKFAKGDEIVLTQTPVRNGYKFDGWEYNGAPFTMTEMPEYDITLTAKWKEAVTITFETGTAQYTVAPIVEEAGAKISAPAIHRKGWHVKNWLLNGVPYTFDTMPSTNITLTAEWEKLTNLPAMFVDLDGRYPLSQVDRINYIDSKITLTNTDEKFEFDNLKSGFRGRGNGSWTDSGDKKGYKLKFDKKQSLFGREANKHWVLIACANFDDVTMSRNYLAYNMTNAVFDKIEYTTQARWLDLYVNGEYRGVYLLCEHVRVGKGRVDIESDYLSENFENTGYLIEYDYYALNPTKGESLTEGIDYFTLDCLPEGRNAFTVHSPDPEDYLEEGNVSRATYMKQVTYIKDYVKRVYEAALDGRWNDFAELADTESFVDMYILHELFKNVDTGYSSFYLYKKPNGKLYAGPVWDFDATTNISDRGDRTPQGIYVAGSIKDDFPLGASELYIALYQTSGFKNAVKARWKVLSPKIQNYLNETLNDEFYAEYKAAMGKNFAMWKNKPQTAAESDWVRDIKALKQWLLDRITWLNTEWK